MLVYAAQAATYMLVMTHYKKKNRTHWWTFTHWELCVWLHRPNNHRPCCLKWKFELISKQVWKKMSENFSQMWKIRSSLLSWHDVSFLNTHTQVVKQAQKVNCKLLISCCLSFCWNQDLPAWALTQDQLSSPQMWQEAKMGPLCIARPSRPPSPLFII